MTDVYPPTTTFTSWIQHVDNPQETVGAFCLLQDLFHEMKFYRARVIVIREYLENNYLNKIRGLIFIELHKAYKL